MNNQNPGRQELYRKKHVLIVEDDPQGGKLIEMVLNKLGVGNISRTLNGKNGWEAINNSDGNFDLVISDWNMPEMTGIELLSKVRHEYGNLPFIMITGRGTMESAVDAQGEGVTWFISKPYSPQKLIEKITDVFEGKIYESD